MKGKCKLTVRQMFAYMYCVFNGDNTKIAEEVYINASTGLMGNGRPTKLEKIFRDRPNVVLDYLKDNNVDLSDYLVAGLDDDFPEDINKRNVKQFYLGNYKMIQLVYFKNKA